MLLIWPALYNRYPLLYPDSVSYLEDGRPVASAIFLHKFSAHYGIRSLIYSLGILPWHAPWPASVTPWPVVILQAFLAAFVLWLVVRSILPRRTAPWYLGLLVFLSALTSLSWFVSLIMPDVLGPLLYLGVYLLVFARASLSRWELFAVALISWWAVTSHPTHLALVCGLILFLALISGVRAAVKGRLKIADDPWTGLGVVSVIVLLACASQCGLNTYLYGVASLNGDRPPFLMARVIADGPGRWYLQAHCPQAKLLLCNHIDNLSDDADDFLWGENGVWSNVDHAGEKRLRAEELRFVMATLRAYPRAQLSQSAANFWRQLKTFEIWDFDPNSWMVSELDNAMPNGRSSFFKSRQAGDALPSDFFGEMQSWTVFVSLAMVVIFVPLVWRRFERLVGLTLVIVPVILANAMVTGVLSAVEERYQSRLVWLLPLLAALLILGRFLSREALNEGDA